MDRRTLLWTGGLGLVAVGAGVGLSRLAPGRRAPVRGGLASLAPAITETTFALARGDHLVARTPYCTLPPAAVALPEVGTALTADLEALARVGPARILVDGSAAAQVEVLSRVAPVEVLPWLTLAEVVASVGALGDWVDARTEADALVDRLQTGLAPAAGGGPRLLVLLAGPELEAGGPFWFIKTRSLHGSAIAASGFVPAIPAPWNGPPQLSAEALLEADPDVIAILSAGAPGTADPGPWFTALRKMPLTACRHERLHLLEGSDLLSVGPSILGLVDTLRGLHPRAP